MTVQDEAELTVFRRFTKATDLPIATDSIEKRDPPEPDILCSLHTGERVAFELVEICNSTNCRFMFLAPKIHEAIMAAYDNLPCDFRAVFDQRFLPQPLSFYFKEEASLNQIKNAIPLLLTELISASPLNDEFVLFSQPVKRVLISTRMAGRMNNFDAVNFNIAGQVDPLIPLEGISAKLSKQYHTDCPVELVAHFGEFTSGINPMFNDDLVKLLNDCGLGQFRRIWILQESNAWAVKSAA